MARKSYSPEFRLSIVLEALKERKILQEIASEHGIAPSQISRPFQTSNPTELRCSLKTTNLPREWNYWKLSSVLGTK